MPDVRYNYAQIGKAVQTLAVHPGRVEERLTEAANHLAIVDPSIFQTAITTAPRDERRGVFGPSIDRLTETEASEIAHPLKPSIAFDWVAPPVIEAVHATEKGPRDVDAMSFHDCKRKVCAVTGPQSTT